MNIFVSYECPIRSARVLDDVRLNKMVLELAQMLCTALRSWGATHGVDGVDLYRSTHANHPCNVWVREADGNWAWSYMHFKALAEEYNRRTGKVHGVWTKAKGWRLPAMFKQVRPKKLKVGRTPFANCAANSAIDLSFKHEKDVHVAYRKYLRARWRRDTRPPKCSVNYLYQ